MELLKPLKRSARYAAIRPRVADPKPLDAWQTQGPHYFLFQLHAVNGDPEPPCALFTMRWEDNEPLSVIIVMPNTTPPGDVWTEPSTFKSRRTNSQPVCRHPIPNAASPGLVPTCLVRRSLLESRAQESYAFGTRH